MTDEPRVTNSLLRERVLYKMRVDHRIHPREIVERAGLDMDERDLTRSLGLRVSYTRNGKDHYQETISEPLALKVARACYIDPYEIDL